MLAGEYEDHQAILRIKTDIEHKDPALRDWGAFRIRKMAHPRSVIGNKYCVWPLLDFAGAIEDHELGMTHISGEKTLWTAKKGRAISTNTLAGNIQEQLIGGGLKSMSSVNSVLVASEKLLKVENTVVGMIPDCPQFGHFAGEE